MRQHAQKFWARVRETRGCWWWTGPVGTSGYGQFHPVRKTPWSAHRVAWQLAYGQIPAGMHVLHRCDNKICVKPTHLFLGTHGDNMRDMCAKGRSRYAPVLGGDHPSSKLTREAAIAIKLELVRGNKHRPGNAAELAMRYGVTRSAVYSIGSGRTWRHV